MLLFNLFYLQQKYSLYPTKDSIAKLVDPVTGSQHNLNELDELANALSDFYQDLNENDGVGSNSVEDISQPVLVFVLFIHDYLKFLTCTLGIAKGNFIDV